MFRGRIIGIASMAIIALCVSAELAQSARKPEPQSSSGSTLADRLASLRKKFLKEDDAAEFDAPSERQNSPTIGPRYSRTKASAHKQTQTASASKSSRTGLPRITASDLLPSGLFSRSANEADDSVEAEPLPRRGSVPRAGSFSARKNPTTKNQQRKTARRSPPVQRQSETESALADLRDLDRDLDQEDSTFGSADRPTDRQMAAPLPSSQQDAPEADRSQANAASPKVTTSEQLSTRPAPFDMQRALLGADLENLIAKEAADSSATNPEEPQSAQTAAPSHLPVTSEPAPGVFGSIASENSLREAPSELTDEEAMNAFSNSGRTAPKRKPAAETPNRLGQRTAPAAKDMSSNEDVLMNYREPVIVSRVEGPRKILVGREANYRVTLQNTSQQTAHDLHATVRIPDGVDVVDVTSTRGVVQRESGSENVLQWQIRELESDTKQTLRLRLIPRSGQALQLGIRWSQATVGSEAMVEVQVPKLQMKIGGPDQVLFGKPQRYRLSLSNPGTGIADNVVIHLIPPGGNPDAALKHAVGSLQPGEAKEIELELTAKEAGDLIMMATAVAEGGIKSEVTKPVLCMKPELKLDWRGPKSKYAGTVATYFFRLQNPGTAKTDSLTVDLQLPEGATFVSASEGHSVESRRGLVTWNVKGLSPKEERFLQIRCHIDRGGINNLAINAQTKSGDLSASQSIQTEVITLADLKLVVSDPRGPVAVGDPADYVIRVRNQGTTGAQDVNIVALFSEGIDPESVEGAQYTVRDGRITFRPIKNLPAGEEIVLRIRAEASQPGNHIFRTEVFCPDLDIKLSAEETTRFFENDYHWEEGETPYSAERDETTTR